MLSIRNPEVDQLARKLAGEQGVSMTDAILMALRRLNVDEAERNARRKEILQSIADACCRLPDLDVRSPDEILGYNADGGFGDGRR